MGDIKIVDVSLIALPVLLAGIYYGPLAGGIAGFIAESVGFFLMPVGTFNPVFSVLMAIAGVIAGLFFLKSDKAGFFRIAGLVTLSQVLCSFYTWNVDDSFILRCSFISASSGQSYWTANKNTGFDWASNYTGWQTYACYKKPKKVK